MQHADGTEEDQRGMSEMSQMRGENDEKKITRVVLRGENHIQKESSQKGKKNIHQGSFNYVCC